MINTYAENQEEYIAQKVIEIQTASEQHKNRVPWNIINQVFGRNNISSIKSNSLEESVSLWKIHFQNLLGQPPEIINDPTEQIVNQQPEIKVSNFSMDELSICIKRSANNKATGLDGIPAEVWKNCNLKEPLQKICNKILNSNKKTTIWGKRSIIQIPKKEYLTITANCRGISLTCIAAKIFNKM